MENKGLIKLQEIWLTMKPEKLFLTPLMGIIKKQTQSKQNCFNGLHKSIPGEIMVQ